MTCSWSSQAASGCLSPIRAGQERVLRFNGPGDVLGEAAFMAETAHATTAVAVDDAAVWRLARADFDTLLGSNDKVLRYLATIIADRQAQANARLAAESAPEDPRAQRGYFTAVYSPRGGAGVTTLAVNLAIALAEQHPDDTVLFDLDVLFGHALSNLWLEPRGVLAQAAPAAMGPRSCRPELLPDRPRQLAAHLAAAKAEDGQAITGDHVRAHAGTLRRQLRACRARACRIGFSRGCAGRPRAGRSRAVWSPRPIEYVRRLSSVRRIFVEVLGLPRER